MSNTSTDPTLSALQDDIAALKRDLGSILSHLKSDATSSAQTTADQIADGAAGLYRTASSASAISAAVCCRAER